MKRVFLFIMLIFIGLVGAGGYYFWTQSQGVPADELASQYLKPTDQFMNISGARVRVRIEGPEDGQPILLLHGFTHSLETWDGWAESLAGQYRVIRYDLLGHGLTGPDPQNRYAPAERAAFIGDVMAALGIEKTIIAGNSLGGLAAWRFAAMEPDRVEALILVSPAAYSINGVADQPADIPPGMQAYLLTVPEAGVKASAEIIYSDDTKITDMRLSTMRDMMRREGNGAAMVASLEEFTLPDPTADLARVTVPTLLLWGEDDALISVDHGERMRDAMPSATLRTYPGVGHAAQEEIPTQSA